jgi:hypothetical protein
MATILDKDITRESTVQIEGREIQVTLTADQQISFKLKGMKSGILNIGIEQLYNQLAGSEESIVDVPAVSETKVSKARKKPTDEPMISLYRLRSLSMVTKMDLSIKVELEKVICDLINNEHFRLED